LAVGLPSVNANITPKNPFQYCRLINNSQNNY